MKHFTDRVYYLERDGAMAHIGFLTSGSWVLYLLEADADWEWDVEGVYPQFEDAFRRIAYRDPLVLLNEEWY